MHKLQASNDTLEVQRRQNYHFSVALLAVSNMGEADV
jgi:hypothetical protein